MLAGSYILGQPGFSYKPEGSPVCGILIAFSPLSGQTAGK
jgi:hypothetical protein